MSFQVINLNDTTPAPPAGKVNVKWQKGASSGIDPATGLPIYPVSAYEDLPVPFVGDTGSGGVQGLVPAPPAGSAAKLEVLGAGGSFVLLPMIIGFLMSSGTAGTNAGPELSPNRPGQAVRCKIIVKASDPTTDLTFRIMQNGVNVFSANPTVTHGTASGTVQFSTSLTSVPLAVAKDDIFTIDVTAGTSTWQFTAQLES